MKTCGTCNEEKHVSSFCKHRLHKDGLSSICKVCASKAHKRWRNKNVDKGKTYQQQYYQANKQKLKSVTVEYKKTHPKNVAMWGRRWRKKNPERQKEYRKREYKRNRLNPMFRLHSNIRCVLSRCINKKRVGKKTFEILGYTLDELKSHIESQFTDGMTWDNYGNWHIDHIIAKSFFVFNSIDDVEFKMCWRLENLQPLWAKDNMSKGNKILQVA